MYSMKLIMQLESKSRLDEQVFSLYQDMILIWQQSTP